MNKDVKNSNNSCQKNVVAERLRVSERVSEKLGYSGVEGVGANIYSGHAEKKEIQAYDKERSVLWEISSLGFL
jgi:hypothetical protein